MTDSKVDPELNAIQIIIGVLEPLDTDARKRVADYVSRSLKIAFGVDISTTRTELASDLSQTNRQPSRVIDIRSLRAQRQPSSANEMAALVAFYLAELAPPEERKTAIDRSDIEKYFKQAGFPLPKAVRQTLPNAATSGFFDITGGGRYRLNAVGYNLVVHGLPSKVKSKE